MKVFTTEQSFNYNYPYNHYFICTFDYHYTTFNRGKEMYNDELLKLSKQNPRFKALLELLNSNTPNIHLKGLYGSASPLYFAPLSSSLARSVVFILNDLEQAGYFYHDLCQILGEKKVLFFPSAYKRAIRYGQIDAANEILRTEALTQINSSNEPVLIVTYPEALAEKVVSTKVLSASSLDLAVGARIDSKFVAETLFEYGFERVDYVYEPGQYAVRGSILDVFSFSHEQPYRIDFFGDEVESMRIFDIESQLSSSSVKTLTLVPNLSRPSSQGVSMLNFIKEDSVVACMDLSWICEKVSSIASDPISEQLLIAEDGDVEVAKKIVDDTAFKKDILSFQRIDFGNRAYSTNATTLEFSISPQPNFHKNFDLISSQFAELEQRGFTINILSDSDKQIKRIHEIFKDRGDKVAFKGIEKALHEGFIDNDSMTCFFTDHQIFDRYHKYNLKSEQARSGKIALSLKEIHQFEIGDYIVHIDHGVGKFGGLIRIPVEDKTQEVIKLIYANDDVLFVSIHSLHKLAKYRGKDGVPPKINKLGSGVWEKMKDKTKSKVKDIARDLILLYAKRKDQKGYSFSPDSFLQQELEASFIYEDTPDQLTSTVDVKRDMESDKPMDRLICGDVGFGKTEIAIRAAFKAATDGKQVAVLVPTTVLAFQHYKTFKERLKDFPVEIDYLTRARTPKQTKALLQSLPEGKPDIIVGTHKLIGKDIKFKDLGLLIIDEEQKFGVAVKEKLKQLKSNVDTLTMTATPIPRTLQFSLMGARDLSVIATPPSNRYPIQTEIHRFDDEIIKEAINFEMSRNGQVFFINNRVQQLGELAEKIKKLVPDARVVIGHGQMEPSKLEKVIIDFSNHEYDVLLATTIIESGIDIPNSNTIIVNNAQNFGLSELHQLRGRVGRSNKKAFCYLLAPPLHSLSSEARRRLQAIENFSELGSGIHIAMQDLDIRGAGNLLGGEQSGFIADLGYETYQRILKEAVEELKTEEFYALYEEEADTKDTERAWVSECMVESDLELLFPDSYIPSSSERIAIYKELDSMEKEQEVHNFTSRLKDRFGKIPKSGEELIRVVTLRQLGKQLGFDKIMLKQGKLYLYFISNEASKYFESDAFGKVLGYLQNNVKRAKLRDMRGRKSMLIFDVKSVKAANEILNEIINISI